MLSSLSLLSKFRWLRWAISSWSALTRLASTVIPVDPANYCSGQPWDIKQYLALFNLACVILQTVVFQQTLIDQNPLNNNSHVRYSVAYPTMKKLLNLTLPLLYALIVPVGFLHPEIPTRLLSAGHPPPSFLALLFAGEASIWQLQHRASLQHSSVFSLCLQSVLFFSDRIRDWEETGQSLPHLSSRHPCSGDLRPSLLGNQKNHSFDLP